RGVAWSDRGAASSAAALRFSSTSRQPPPSSHIKSSLCPAISSDCSAKSRGATIPRRDTRSFSRNWTATARHFLACSPLTATSLYGTGRDPAASRGDTSRDTFSHNRSFTVAFDLLFNQVRARTATETFAEHSPVYLLELIFGCSNLDAL